MFTAGKAAIFPEPAAANPMEVALLVQLNTVEATVPEKATAAVDAPLQTVWLFNAATVGVGFTVMVNVLGFPLQLMPFPV